MSVDSVKTCPFLKSDCIGKNCQLWVKIGTLEPCCVFISLAVAVESLENMSAFKKL
jgi:hypothetical protein